MVKKDQFLDERVTPDGPVIMNGPRVVERSRGLAVADPADGKRPEVDFQDHKAAHPLRVAPPLRNDSLILRILHGFIRPRRAA
jgi:DNA-binding cell septation regulator SpoVG